MRTAEDKNITSIQVSNPRPSGYIKVLCVYVVGASDKTKTLLQYSPPTK